MELVTLATHTDLIGAEYTAAKVSPPDWGISVPKLLTDFSHTHVLLNMGLTAAIDAYFGALDVSGKDYPIRSQDVYSVEVVTPNKRSLLVFTETLYNSIASNNAIGLLFEDIIPEIKLDITGDQLATAIELLSRNVTPNVAVTCVECSELSDTARAKGTVSNSTIMEILTREKYELCKETYLAKLNKKRRYDIKKSLAAIESLVLHRIVTATPTLWQYIFKMLATNFSDSGRGLENDYSYDVALYQWASVRSMYSGNRTERDRHILITDNPLYIVVDPEHYEKRILGAICFVKRADGSYSFHSFAMDHENAPDGMGKALLFQAATALASEMSSRTSVLTIDTGSATAPWEDSEDHYGIYKRKCSTGEVPKISMIASRLPKSYAPYYNVTTQEWVLENE